MTTTVYTYEDVAKTLPHQIREDIELSVPCTAGHGQGHLWNWERQPVYISTLARPIRVDEWWWCWNCRVVTRTRPIPPVNRPWAIITADEIMGMIR